jgi:hypothetical protein
MPPHIIESCFQTLLLFTEKQRPSLPRYVTLTITRRTDACGATRPDAGSIIDTTVSIIRISVLYNGFG